MNTIITVLTVMNMYMNCMLSNNQSYYYNADIENGAVKTMYVYELCGHQLVQKLAYDFSYDEQGRLTEKTARKWNSCDGEYEPSYQLQLTYNADGYELERRTWNERTETWRPAVEKTVYKMNGDQLTSMNYLRRDSKGDFESVDMIYMMSDTDHLLLAHTNGK